MNEVYSKLPLVYACSGCSNAAQLANTLAVRLDREQRAEMSCIAGVGGDVRALLKTARSGRQILVLDGCPLHCARSCLARHAIEPHAHVDLSKFGVKKNYHEDVEPQVAQEVWRTVVLPALQQLTAHQPQPYS
jgi:uncharacterized metal-binding protein